MSPRGLLVSFMALVFLGGAAPRASAADYPTHSVNIIVPFTPAGATDILARMAALTWEQQLGKSFVVENRPGAGQQIGVNAVAKAAPDGHTLLVVPSTQGTNPFLYASLPYDTDRDFAPISLIASTPYVFVSHPDLPVKSFRELIVLLKKNPGKYQYASTSPGTAQHLGAELVRVLLL